MIDDIRRHIQEEMRWLARRVYATGDDMRAALRIEIGYDTFPKLMFGLESFGVDALYNRAAPMRQEGPMKLEGVPLFKVEWLPDPGWRVVNVARKLLS